MAFIQGSSNIAIHESQFTIVQGSQHNTHVHVNYERQRQNELTIWDDYRRIRTGDIYLTKVIGNSDASKDTLYRLSRRRRGDSDARRTISVARVRGEGKDEEFLYVRYSGKDALEVFKRDFYEFSAVKDLNVAQLFGYNNNRRGIPALIFYYDALIPLNRVLSVEHESQGFPFLYVYFQFLLGALRMCEERHYFNLDELWIEPRSGTLRRGPRVENHVIGDIGPSRVFDVPSDPPLGLLSVRAYNNTSIVFDYLIRILSTDVLLEVVSEAYKSSWERLTAVEAWSYLPDLLWRMNDRDSIVWWTGFAERLQCVCVQHSQWAGDEGVVMKDGTIRYQVSGLVNCGHLSLTYRFLHNGELDMEKWWLAQAHRVFGQLGIPEEEWQEYSITTRFWLGLYPTKGNTCQQEYTNTMSGNPATYLFIQPISCVSEDGSIWGSRAESPEYFWSFDPSGQEEMSESTRASLGLPSFTTKIDLRWQTWDLGAYKAVEMMHLSKGFDPETTAFARSLGFPIVQPIGDEDRFQNLDDSSIVICDDRSTEGYDSDERVLYPRLREGAE
ncbi:hypothetical protein WG66_000141 [Moniliophthora roreri]|uniref:Protein kinase domain-containing protein n=1 Tax=Moniliophthora roreri TaxID=221103 RepID=A0A0W0EYC8_MONRR|nr:hypothetical protein WG66_000141 [Moniliophthora roreri]